MVFIFVDIQIPVVIRMESMSKLHKEGEVLKSYFKWAKQSSVKAYDVCFLVGTGWHSVHEQIPIMVWLKEKCDNVSVLTVVPEDNGLEVSNYAKDTFAILMKYSDAVIIQNWMQTKCSLLSRLHLSIHKKIMRKYLAVQLDELFREIKIGNIFWGEDNKTLAFSYMWKKFPPNKHNYYCISGSSFPKTCRLFDVGKSEAYPSDPVLLETTKFMVNEVERNEVYRYKKGVYTGSPLFDSWWRRKSQSLFSSAKLNKNDRIVIAIALPRLDSTSLVRLTAFEQQGIIDFMNNNRQFEYLISFHPRDSYRLKSFFLNKIYADYEICGEGLVVQSACSDMLVFCGLSTGVGDSLVTGKPVVEFYDDTLKDRFSTNWWYKDNDGFYGTYFYVNKLLPHARTAAELKQCIYDCLHDNLWTKYKDRYKSHIEIMPSCQLIAEQLLKRNNVNNI